MHANTEGFAGGPRDDETSLRVHDWPDYDDDESRSNETSNYSVFRPMLRRRARIVAGRNSPHENSSHELTPSEWSDWSEEGNLPAGCRGIVNPNYPGFQHLAPSLLSDTDLTEDEHDSCSDYPPHYPGVHQEQTPLENGNEYNNNVDDSINHLYGQRNDRKVFYEKPKFNIQVTCLTWTDRPFT